VFAAIGLSMPPEKAFRPATDPSVKDGWFYECWMDEKQSEQLLGFQRTSREVYMDELRRRHRLQRLALFPIRPLVARTLTAASPYIGRGAITPGRTLWNDVFRVYDLPTEVARTRSSKPSPPSPFATPPSP
jgi:hypothetical protein